MRRVPWLIAVIAAACAEPSHDVSRRSAAVIIPAGARNVQYTVAGGAEYVAYEVDARHPAGPLITVIEQTMRANGWSRDPRPSTFLWRHYVDARSTPRRDVEHWRGVWRSRSGAEAEYILEFRDGREGPLQVRAQVGGTVPNDTAIVHGTAAVTAQPELASIELRAGDALVLCGDDGTAILEIAGVTGTSARASWRFRDARGETAGTTVVSERAGAASGSIDSSGARFHAGAYEVLWSPASVTLDERKQVTEATSWLQYDAGLRGRTIAAKDARTLDLASACR